MPDIFADFRWREVVSVVVAFVTVVAFFVVIMIDVMRDLDMVIRTESQELRPRIRALEIGLVQLKARLEVERILRICADRPEVCEE